MRARLAELPFLVVFLGLTGVLALLPALHAMATDDHEVARAFLYSGLILLILTAMIGIATAGYTPRDSARSLLAACVGAYALLPVAMALPFLEAVPDTSFMNAWFEMISSFTTTGASAYEADRLAPSVHLWRALVGWFGGFFTLLAAYAILAPLNLGGAEVASGRVAGRGAGGSAQVARAGDATERLTRIAFQILPVYSALTLALWLGLLLAGETGITALVHAMGTMSTSGITGPTPLAESGAGLPGEMLILAFLIFAVTHRAFPGLQTARSRGPLLADPELRLAALVILLVTGLLFLRHFSIADAAAIDSDASTVFASLWGIFFTATSFLTTTGYVSADWLTAELWSGAGTSGMVLMGLAILGGSTATTAGGVKLLRVYALLRHGERELDRVIHPSSIARGGSELRRITGKGAQIAWVFFMLFGISIAATIAILSILGVDFEIALVLSLASLTTTGPLADLGSVDAISHDQLTDPVKFTLGIAMAVGRLETLALLALILPGGGRR